MAEAEAGLRPWRPRAFEDPSNATFAAEPPPDDALPPEPPRGRDTTPADVGLSREERQRLWQEGFDAGQAAAQEAAGAETERLHATLNSANETFATTLAEVARLRGTFSEELEQTLEDVLEAICATVLDTCWVRDEALLRRCVHAALEAFDELHPSLQIRVPPADAERVESILADAALALPVVADDQLSAGQIHVDGVARAVLLDLPDRFHRVLNMVQGQHE